jgi:tripartite-type tricarboxylate transporter receptor subunit TctC
MWLAYYTREMGMRRAAVLFSALVLWSAAFAAGAQSWPARPVKIIVPFAAGRSRRHLRARGSPEKLQGALGQPFVVEDKPGGGSIVGTDFVAKSPADGYTLLMMSNTHTVNESLIPDRPFQLLRDFVPVAPVNYSDLVMVVHPSVPANSLREFIALAEGEAGPAQLRLVGPGHAVPHGGRALQVDGRASTSCTCPTRGARARAPTSSAARCR